MAVELRSATPEPRSASPKDIRKTTIMHPAGGETVESFQYEFCMIEPKAVADLYMSHGSVDTRPHLISLLNTPGNEIEKATYYHIQLQRTLRHPES
eukprot:gene8220-7559_t